MEAFEMEQVGAKRLPGVYWPVQTAPKQRITGPRLALGIVALITFILGFAVAPGWWVLTAIFTVFTWVDKPIRLEFREPAQSIQLDIVSSQRTSALGEDVYSRSIYGRL